MATKTTKSKTVSTTYYDANATIVLKNSTVRGKVPAPSDLEIGEVALSLYKGEESIWAKNSQGNIVKLNEVTKENLWDKDSAIFLNYNNYIYFLEDLEAGSIDPKSIVFVSDETHRGIWTQGTFYRSFDPEKYYTKEETDDIFLTKTEADEKYITGSDVATEDHDGLMSAEDKARLDNIYNGDKEVAVPEIKGEWNIYDNSESFVETKNVSDISYEKGYKVQWEGTYKWIHSEDYKDPTSIGPGSAWDTLTESGIRSNVYESELIEEDTEISIELRAPRTGLTLDDKNTVISAEGQYDSSKAAVSVTFMNRAYYGTLETSNPGSSDVLGLDSQFIDTRVFTIPAVNCDEDEYYCYAYPKDLGNLKSIQENETNSVLGAFTRKEVVITNEAGLTITLNVYITNNPGAFTNSSLEFR